mgnify:CR=1 FL=1
MKTIVVDKAEYEWRGAFMERKAEGFGPDEWIRTTWTTTIKPGESIAEIERQLSREYRVKIRLSLFDL